MEYTLFDIAIILAPVSWALGVFKENSDKTLSRSKFLLIFVVAPVAISFLGYFFTLAEWSRELKVLIMLNLLTYTYGFISVRRARDAGWDKKHTYATLIPLIGPFIFLILFFKKSEEPGILVDMAEQKKKPDGL